MKLLKKIGKVFFSLGVAATVVSCSEDEVKNFFNDEDNTVKALKEALTIGAQNSSEALGKEGGYLEDAAVKILLPEEAQTTFKAVKAITGNAAVQKLFSALDVDLDPDLESTLVTAFNRAAEDAAPQAAGVFATAITNMTLDDGKAILFSSSNDAATNYLKTNTYSGLKTAFSPIIEESMDNVSVAGLTATEAWAKFAQMNNKLAEFKADNAQILNLASALLDDSDMDAINSIQTVNTSLGGYVTDRALDGLFKKVAVEEEKIRTDASARVTNLLKDVFGQLD